MELEGISDSAQVNQSFFHINSDLSPIPSSDEYEKQSKKNLILKGIGIILILIGVIDGILMYYVPHKEIVKAKESYPTAQFVEPHKAIVFIHFLLHFAVVFAGVSLLIEKEKLQISDRVITGSSLTIISCFLVVIIWIFQIVFNFNYAENPEHQQHISELNKILIDKDPVDLVFIYTKGEKKTRTCTGSRCESDYVDCYSSSGISIPLESSRTTKDFQVNSAPPVFFLELDQDIKVSTNTTKIINHFITLSKECNEYDRKYDFYPIYEGTHLVYNTTIPKVLSDKTRLLTAIFGVGVYYELYSKSFPYIYHKQGLNVDIIPDYDYSSITINCKHLKCEKGKGRPGPPGY